MVIPIISEMKVDLAERWAIPRDTFEGMVNAATTVIVQISATVCISLRYLPSEKLPCFSFSFTEFIDAQIMPQ